MCGIAGILNFNHKPVAYNQIKSMTDTLIHRGPDGEGHYVDHCVALGHRRLAIIDLSAAGHQPMQTRDGRFFITYNGEIYNFQELRIELESLGYQFHSRTDSEVVLNAYAQWGAKSIEKFNGMFALAIWDKKEKKLFIARDRYGIKPLYYYISASCFVFASEIKAILTYDLCHTNLDKEAVVEYLTFQNLLTDRTLFKDIKLLKSGHYAEIDMKGGFTSHQFWDFDFQSKLKISESEAIEELDRLFTQAVQRQLVSDVPVNSYLSGGIDSGAITMVASRHVKHMRTFTIGFDLSSASGLELSFDERPQAEYISYLAKSEHYEMVLKAGDMERCMKKLVTHLEEPRVGQSYPNYYAAKLASKFSKVVLAGTAGDELFAGYPWRYFHGDTQNNFENFIDQYYMTWQRLIPNTTLKKFLSPISKDITHVWTRDIFANVFKKSMHTNKLSKETCLNHSLYFEAKCFLHGLLVVEDKLSMAHSLETRVPFLDNDLVDFSIKIPNSYKINDSNHEIINENQILDKRLARRSNGKLILKKTLQSYLDFPILDSIKQGFSAPDASWFRGESINYVKDELYNKNSALYNICDYNMILNIIEEHTSSKKNHRLLIWSLIYLNNFLNIFKINS